jgi:hypothetical protein
MIYAPDLIIIIICVDDLIFGSKSQRAIDRYEMEIQLRFDMEDIIEYGHYLGIRITTTKQYSSLKKHTFNDSFRNFPSQSTRTSTRHYRLTSGLIVPKSTLSTRRN